MHPWIVVAYSAPVTAATTVFLIYPIGQGSFSEGMSLGISGTFNYSIYISTAHLDKLVPGFCSDMLLRGSIPRTYQAKKKNIYIYIHTLAHTDTNAQARVCWHTNILFGSNLDIATLDNRFIYVNFFFFHCY